MVIEVQPQACRTASVVVKLLLEGGDKTDGATPIHTVCRWLHSKSRTERWI
jgi:hypothetical protein